MRGVRYERETRPCEGNRTGDDMRKCILALAAIALTLNTACSTPVEPADEPTVEDGYVAETVEWQDELNYISVLDFDNNLFFTEESGVVYKYLDSETWWRIDVPQFGLQTVGYGLTTQSDWQNGTATLVDIDGYTLAKSPIGSIHDVDVDERLSLAADDLVNCGPDENGDGYGDGTGCYAVLEILRQDPETRPFTCKGDDDYGNEDITNIGVSLVSGWVMPRQDNCGLNYNEG